jgi:hypothetical protein
MNFRYYAGFLGWALLFVLGLNAKVVRADGACAYDKAKLMALDEPRFDQGSSGWRAIGEKPGCEAIAADLIRDYRELHGDESFILFWHEGQLRAIAGDYQQAIILMTRSRRRIAVDMTGWNQYVDATIAFLQKNKPALLAARTRLVEVQPQSLNLDVVGGLIRCFSKSYGAAYGKNCRLQ